VEAALMSRESILHKVRTALGRSEGQEIGEPPAIYLPEPPSIPKETRIEMLRSRIEALAGKTHRASSVGEVRASVEAALAGRDAVASNAPFLIDCGVTGIPGVRTGFRDREELREVCAAVPVGITSADYALADTGTLVMLSSAAEARMISLLPPAHIAVVPAGSILTGLDELFASLPNPSEATSSMVLITGPSRTADIEQILVRGVHGPGEITVIVAG
jgi:L-lactate utilization protein LutC